MDNRAALDVDFEGTTTETTALKRKHPDPEIDKIREGIEWIISRKQPGVVSRIVKHAGISAATLDRFRARHNVSGRNYVALKRIVEASGYLTKSRPTTTDFLFEGVPPTQEPKPAPSDSGDWNFERVCGHISDQLESLQQDMACVHIPPETRLRLYMRALATLKDYATLLQQHVDADFDLDSIHIVVEDDEGAN